ncbi:MAG: hypothetical protein QOC92_3358, partial [Acidimicrobiaceae bacterium]
MELELTTDQRLFRETTRKFLEAECPITAVRALEHDQRGYDMEYWRRGAALGWTSMLIDEADGGGNVSGEGLLDLVLIAEEMGRRVAPGPFLPTNVVAGALALSGSPQQRAAVLPGIVAGQIVAAWCHAGVGRRGDAHAVPIEGTGGGGDGFVLSGMAAPVEAAAQASYLLVPARTGSEVSQFMVAADAPGVVITPMAGIDLVKRFAEVRFDSVEVPATALVGEAGTGSTEIEHQLQRAICLQCAETVGAIDRVFEFTLEYMDDRHSFGRSLSSYQALKHRFADMKVWLEACHAAANGAARAVQHRDGDAGEMVSAAAAYIGYHAVEIIHDCVQMHGGIGVTWEH